MTYRGQTTTGHLPRWLGDDGNITYGTRIPHIVVKTTETGGFTFQETQNLYSTFRSVGVVLTQPVVGEVTTVKEVMGKETKGWEHDSGNSGGSRWYVQQKHKQIIAGSVIGGFMVLVIVTFTVGVLVAWRRKMKRDEMGKGDEGVELREVESRDDVREEERRVA